MASRGKNMPFSANRRERVLYAESGDFLSRVQVFRKNPCCAALGGSSDDECIPETDTRFVFNAECHGKLNGSRFHAPDRVATKLQGEPNRLAGESESCGLRSRRIPAKLAGSEHQCVRSKVHAECFWRLYVWVLNRHRERKSARWYRRRSYRSCNSSRLAGAEQPK